MSQIDLFDPTSSPPRSRPRGQLLKWIGSKHRVSDGIAGFFPRDFRRYFEPFLGTGAVLGALAPKSGFGSDAFAPLIEIWRALKVNPELLCEWYATRWRRFTAGERVTEYERIKASFNGRPNGADLLFLSRACYGGVVRFRRDGYMSTPCGPHRPISPEAFEARVREWHRRVRGCDFECMHFADAMLLAKRGDLIYCDPPYRHTQSILYGAQDFDLGELYDVIDRCRSRGVRVALSIDGSKKSGQVACEVAAPEGLFEREITVPCGRSMLRRFQMPGQTLEAEHVVDRLLLTY